ncbi:phosphoribosylformylglycinamidine cyclo-ligase [Myxococcota bacterium]|jgi:phosphoribosylformylglycinamidine cyclo-ligase|nr:phosphoribosylformylglycinamidine cyclo-ligase [Myxococcota bacterium]
MSKGTTYRQAGVDIEAGDALVERIKPMALRTRRPGVLGGLGGFGGLFSLKDAGRYDDPVLVSGTDGVGTKLRLAFHLRRHDTVGLDLVAMCVNDIVTCGAEPLFFLDYFATGKLDPDEAAAVIEGIARGCERAGCALLGGETAELPGFYPGGEYDLAGFAVGVVERAAIIDGRRIAAGDVVVGVASSGLHSNGYSLARAVLPWQDEPGLAAELLTPTRIYARAVAAVRTAADVRGIAHITGGGLPGNLPRIFPEGLGARLRADSWSIPPIFERIAREGPVDRDEMFEAFNMGVGLCVVVPPADAAPAIAALAAAGEVAWRLGEVVSGEGVSWA